MGELSIEIAGLRTGILTRNPEIAEVVRERYKGFLSTGAPRWRIEMKAEAAPGVSSLDDVVVTRDGGLARFLVARGDLAGTVDLEQRRGTVTLARPNEFSIDTFLRIVYSLALVEAHGLVIHRFNPGDHYAGVDRSITGSNFLRFSERQWRWYGGSGLSYHNRLRCIQHREMLQAAGFTILTDDVRIDNRALEAIRSGRLPIHADYAGYTPEQLAADYMWLVGRKET